MSARRILTTLGIAGVLLFVLIFWDDFVQVMQIIRSISWQYLLLIIPIQAWSYFSNAMFYRQTLKSIGAPQPSLGRLYGLSLGTTFTDMVLPSAGASGVSLMATVLRQDGVKVGQAAFIQVARYATIYITFVLLLLFALASLYFADDIARIAIRIVVLLTSIIVSFSVVAGYLIYDRRGFNWLVVKAQSAVDWLSRNFRGGRELIGKRRIKRILAEFHRGVKRAVKSRAFLRQPLWWGLSGNMAEVLTLFVVFMALGFIINPGVVILAYAVANVAGAVTVIPGDIGIYEFAMVSVLSIVGVPLTTGIAATLVYRVINKALILPFGFYFYNRYIRQATDAAGI